MMEEVGNKTEYRAKVSELFNPHNVHPCFKWDIILPFEDRRRIVGSSLHY